MAAFTELLIGILYTPAVAFFLLPVLAIRLVIRFFNWAHRRARGGPDYEALADGYEETGMGIGNRMYYGRRYGEVRRSGMNDRALYRERGGRRRRW